MANTPPHDQWPSAAGPYPPAPPPWTPPGAAASPPWAAPDPDGAPPLPPTSPAPGFPPGSVPRRGGRQRAVVVVAVAALVLALLAFGAGRLSHSNSNDQSAVAPVSVQAVTTAPAPLTGREVEPAAAVARTLGPAVVQLETGRGLGSGFVYDASGLILTAAHVVDGSKQVQVRLADGRRVPGQVRGADDSTDVAVVKIDGVKGLAVAVLATDVKVDVGQTAIAIGSPFGLDRTVTAGIVSAVGRSVETPGGAVPMVQTDAPINPGNSGGALADRRGRVIGVNDSIAGGSGGNVGVGFAVPIDIAKSVADRINGGKSLAAGFLGVEATDAQGSRSGAVVTKVSGDSPAGRAGLRADDIVIGIDGTAVDSSIDLAARVRSHEPGQQVRVTFVRGNDERQVTVTLGKATH